MTNEQMILGHYTKISEALNERNTAKAMAGYDPNVLLFDISPPLRAIGFEKSVRTYNTAFDATEGP
jgi:hypothetical protein